ncbi:uncharacterized protein F5891DRAFT_979519 [Suillus fuscotomentosus]|uniref:Uncharacterized protein n=1 Tax=Suillus fuscotomentosus TaxID=1912939 RepID=A0AAD4EAB6_9AGAM|nr:uncharacterized protein F5891DRAFT_979519 [Suillus fuscotomentosus]KAG1901339.1 hypothetical protein F5891DRAFT_979519 [Suillus fuscotomentosus]
MVWHNKPLQMNFELLSAESPDVKKVHITLSTCAGGEGGVLSDGISLYVIPLEPNLLLVLVFINPSLVPPMLFMHSIIIRVQNQQSYVNWLMQHFIRANAFFCELPKPEPVKLDINYLEHYGMSSMRPIVAHDAKARMGGLPFFFNTLDHGMVYA